MLNKRLQRLVKRIVQEEMTSEAVSGSKAPSGSKFVNKEVKAVVAKGEADIKAAQKRWPVN